MCIAGQASRIDNLKLEAQQREAWSASLDRLDVTNLQPGYMMALQDTVVTCHSGAETLVATQIQPNLSEIRNLTATPTVEGSEDIQKIWKSAPNDGKWDLFLLCSSHAHDMHHRITDDQARICMAERLFRMSRSHARAGLSK